MLDPGDYMKLDNGNWLLCLPNGLYGTVSPQVHTITEHEDGTITISPSILTRSVGARDKMWHGYLERGVWREV